MISEEEASIIAHSYIEGSILKEDCNKKMSTSSYLPIVYEFSIYHEDIDGNIFQTFISVSNNGFVTNWIRRHIDETN